MVLLLKIQKTSLSKIITFLVSAVHGMANLEKHPSGVMRKIVQNKTYFSNFQMVHKTDAKTFLADTRTQPKQGYR
jgi:hypothetical protein